MNRGSTSSFVLIALFAMTCQHAFAERIVLKGVLNTSTSIEMRLDIEQDTVSGVYFVGEYDDADTYLKGMINNGKYIALGEFTNDKNNIVRRWTGKLEDGVFKGGVTEAASPEKESPFSLTVTEKDNGNATEKLQQGNADNQKNGNSSIDNVASAKNAEYQFSFAGICLNDSFEDAYRKLKESDMLDDTQEIEKKCFREVWPFHMAEEFLEDSDLQDLKPGYLEIEVPLKFPLQTATFLFYAPSEKENTLEPILGFKISENGDHVPSLGYPIENNPYYNKLVEKYGEGNSGELETPSTIESDGGVTTARFQELLVRYWVRPKETLKFTISSAEMVMVGNLTWFEVKYINRDYLDQLRIPLNESRSKKAEEDKALVEKSLKQF